MLLSALADSGVAGDLVESVLELGMDATQGQHGPDGTWVPGSAAAGGPGEANRDGSSPGDDRPSARDDDRQPSDSKRRRDMKRNAAETALMDAAANYGRAGTATGIINTAVGGGVALATGIDEIHRNEGRGLGGSGSSARRDMEAAEAEMPQVRPSRKR